LLQLLDIIDIIFSLIKKKKIYQEIVKFTTEVMPGTKQSYTIQEATRSNTREHEHDDDDSCSKRLLLRPAMEKSIHSQLMQSLLYPNG